MNKYKFTENFDFILGYCSHALADMYNNIKFWTPYRLSHPQSIDQIYKRNSDIHNEGLNMEIFLALTYKGKEKFWINLKNSVGINLPNIIYADELEQHKENILNVWYKDKTYTEISQEKMENLNNSINYFVDSIKNIYDQIL